MLSLVVPTTFAVPVGRLAGDGVGVSVAHEGDHHQSEEDAVAADIASVAAAHGWTLRDARVRHDSAEAVGRVATELARLDPDIFVGSRVSLDPTAPPVLYIKGVETDLVRRLVRAEDVPIDVQDRQPFSFEELEARKNRVHRALMEVGYEEVATSVNISGAGIMPVGVRITQGLPDKEEDVLRLVPEDLRGAVDLTLHEERYFGEDHALGGQKTTYTGDNNFCTSGWTVIGPDDVGVVIADHCRPENRISASDHVMTLQDGHYGAYGDVAWYTTNTTELAEFYADRDEIRWVLAIEPVGSLSENETVCRFGRGSKNRNCSAEIQDVSQACGNLNRMVLMNADVSTGGDSGGPWFYGSRAYGSHHGYCGPQSAHDAFSAVDRFDSAIDVFVPVYE